MRIDPDPDLYDPQRLFDMEVKFAPFDGKDRPEQLQQVTLAPHVPMTAADLRNLPWARLLRAAEAIVLAQHSDTIDAWNAATAEAAIEPTRGPGRPKLGYAFIFSVAERYQQLIEAGDPTPALRIAQEHNNAEPSTVRGWIRRARELGFLKPTTQGRAG
jgi:hypothetical protein